jgi:hypothetical protein
VYGDSAGPNRHIRRNQEISPINLIRRVRARSEIVSLQACPFGDTREHRGADFFVVVKGEDEVSPSDAFERSM